jgi:hypothetical protein
LVVLRSIRAGVYNRFRIYRETLSATGQWRQTNPITEQTSAVEALEPVRMLWVH